MKKAAYSFYLIFFMLFQVGTPVYAQSAAQRIELQGYLLSWKDGTAKEKIVSFVESVTTLSSHKFVPKDLRRAFFDMDGTLVCEKPNYLEVVVAEHRLVEKLKKNPSLIRKAIYKAVSEKDSEYLYKHVKEVLAEAFVGETLQFYQDYCKNFLLNQKHPRFSRAYIELFYAPVLELIGYLKDHGFKVYVVSTSQQEFIRSISEVVLNLPHDQIIGTMVGFSLANLEKNEPPVFIRNDKYFDPYNADEAKVVRMRERGVMPSIFAFGNSMGDYAMLDATADSGIPNMVCILNHDDAEREYGYHKPELLEIAKRRGWNIVSMKKDFRVVFRSR